MAKIIETTGKAAKMVAKYSLGGIKSYAQWQMFKWSFLDDAANFGLHMIGEQQFKEGIDTSYEVCYLIKEELEAAALEKTAATLEKVATKVEKAQKEEVKVEKEEVKTEVVPA